MRLPGLRRNYIDLSVNYEDLGGLMKDWVAIFLLAALILFGLGALDVGATEYDLYYLGGQSNMDGYGRVEDLPESLSGPIAGAMIFHGNTARDATPVDGRGVWDELQPGHGVGYSSDGATSTYSNRFGIELTFVRTLQELEPGRKIAIVKYSKGGTSIDREAAGYSGCWDPGYPGVNQFDHFLATIRNATDVVDIDGDGERDTLVPKGIVWMQGESDAGYTVEIAARYEAHLTQLMDLVRAALHADDLPVVIGRISDSGRDDYEGDEKDGMIWNHGGIVRAAQASYVVSDRHAALVTTTDDYGYSDPWHYDSAGYLDLGREFALAMHGLQIEPSMEAADPDPLRFQTEIEVFAIDDDANLPPHPLLFVGSSSIVYWPTATSFPACAALNRGFGGAHISDVLHFYSETVAAYHPRAIVIYAGDNDLADGKSAARVFEDFKSFVATVHRDFPDAPVYFLSIKPSGSRWQLWETMVEVNHLVETWAGTQPKVEYVDVATPMLGGDDTPRDELFVDDRLHLNEKGYELWDSIVGPRLAQFCE